MESRRHPANKAGPAAVRSCPCQLGPRGRQGMSATRSRGASATPTPELGGRCLPPRHPLGCLFSTSDTGPEPPGRAGPPCSLAKEPPPGVG